MYTNLYNFHIAPVEMLYWSLAGLSILAFSNDVLTYVTIAPFNWLQMLCVYTAGHHRGQDVEIDCAPGNSRHLHESRQNIGKVSILLFFNFTLLSASVDFITIWR